MRRILCVERVNYSILFGACGKYHCVAESAPIVSMPAFVNILRPIGAQVAEIQV